MNSSLQKKGFTLIELLVVIAVIGVISSVVLQGLTSARAKTRDTARKTQMQELNTALSHYYSETGSYPSTGGTWWGVSPYFGSHQNSGANGYIPNLAPAYISTLPTDPLSGQVSTRCGRPYPREYLYNSNGVDFKLISFCSPEQTTFSPSDPFYDPMRITTSWQISSPGGLLW